MTTTTFDYKDSAVSVHTQESPDGWSAIVDIRWHGPKPLTVSFASEAVAIENASQFAKSIIDVEDWRFTFRERWTELVCGEVDWEWEVPEDDWTTEEWAKRGDRSGPEHAQMLFDAHTPEWKARYLPGGSAHQYVLETRLNEKLG